MSASLSASSDMDIHFFSSKSGQLFLLEVNLKNRVKLNSMNGVLSLLKFKVKSKIDLYSIVVTLDSY